MIGPTKAPEPTTSCVPALWRYEEVRPHLMQAGDLITAREAQRRVLILVIRFLHPKSPFTEGGEDNQAE